MVKTGELADLELKTHTANHVVCTYLVLFGPYYETVVYRHGEYVPSFVQKTQRREDAVENHHHAVLVWSHPIKAGD